MQIYEQTYISSKFEVDLITGTESAIEIKSTEVVHGKHLMGVRALKEEGFIKSFAIVSNNMTEKTISVPVEISRVFIEKLLK